MSLLVLAAPLLLARQDSSHVAHDFLLLADRYLTGLAQAQRFSGAVLIAVDGKPVLRKAFGYADWATRRPMRLDTPAPIFSISKTFTAAAILLLEDDGKLSVTDPISKHLSDVPDAWGAITIQSLLSHTSGIGAKEGIDWIGKATDRTVAQTVWAASAVATKPPGDYSYSNLGYIVLAKVVERVSGKSLSAFLRERIFGPLDMRGAGIGGYLDGQTQVARGHILLNGKLSPFDQRLAIIPGAGGVHATVDDLLKWRNAVDGGTLFSDRVRAKLHEKVARIDAETTYGNGWIFDSEWPLWKHTGAGAGCSSSLMWLPDRGVTIVIIKNLDAFVGPLGDTEVAELAYGHRVTLAKFPTFDTLDRLQGRYRNGDQHCAVWLEGDKATVSIGGSSAQRLDYRGDGRFESDDFRFRVQTRQDGRLDLSEDRSGSAWKPILPTRPLAAYVGVFRSSDSVVQFVVSGRHLAGRLPMPGVGTRSDVPLFLSGNDTFSMAGFKTGFRFFANKTGRVQAVVTVVDGKSVGQQLRRQPNSESPRTSGDKTQRP